MKIVENTDFAEIRAKMRKKSLTNFCEYFEFGAVRRCVNLVDLEKCSKMRIWTQKSAFIDSISVLLENESGK